MGGKVNNAKIIIASSILNYKTYFDFLYFLREHYFQPDLQWRIELFYYDEIWSEYYLLLNGFCLSKWIYM